MRELRLVMAPLTCARPGRASRLTVTVARTATRTAKPFVARPTPRTTTRPGHVARAALRGCRPHRSHREASYRVTPRPAAESRRGCFSRIARARAPLTVPGSRQPSRERRAPAGSQPRIECRNASRLSIVVLERRRGVARVYADARRSSESRPSSTSATSAGGAVVVRTRSAEWRRSGSTSVRSARTCESSAPSRP